MRIPRRHPGRRRLHRWVDGDEPGLDRHLDSCARCAGIVEELDPPPAAIRDALLTALRPPGDLIPRLERRIEKRVRNRREMRLLGELMMLPFETSRLLIIEEDDDWTPTMDTDDGQ